MTSTDIVLVRATVSLPGGVRPGVLYWVDRTAPYIAEALAPASGEPLLVLVDDGGALPVAVQT